MKRNRSKNTHFAQVILFVAVMAQLSCGENRIEVSDLLGTWIFQNTLSVNDDYTERIDNQLMVQLDSNYRITVASLNYNNERGFDFNIKTFRMLIRYPIAFHTTYYAIWEGEKSGDRTLSGKIYFSRPGDDGGGIMYYEKLLEIGSFTASRISD